MSGNALENLESFSFKFSGVSGDHQCNLGTSINQGHKGYCMTTNGLTLESFLRKSLGTWGHALCYGIGQLALCHGDVFKREGDWIFCAACHRRAGAPQGYYPKSDRWGSPGHRLTNTKSFGEGSTVVGSGPGKT